MHSETLDLSLASLLNVRSLDLAEPEPEQILDTQGQIPCSVG